MNINILRLTDSAKLPERGSASAAGYDLFADVAEDAEIAPHETKMIGTGLAMEIPEGYFGGIFARSGLSAKEGLRPANCVGVVDSDYRGEIKVAIPKFEIKFDRELNDDLEALGIDLAFKDPGKYGYGADFTNMSENNQFIRRFRQKTWMGT